MSTPVLYSFRRCPYAMRARMALAYADITVELREIQLRHKPEHLLCLSPKGTVPVLALENGTVLEESLDIMLWAVSQHDPLGWWPGDAVQRDAMGSLIDKTDCVFKPALDRYKYPDRYTDLDPEQQWLVIHAFLADLESRLQNQSYLFSDSHSLADIAIFPFIRQFAKVDEDKFLSLPYPELIHWLDHYLKSPWFVTAMQRFPVWQADGPGVIFPGAS